MRTDTFTEIIKLIMQNEFKYVLPRRGQVLDDSDPVNKGRVLVSIPIFGWNSKDQGVWCRPVETNSIKTPALDDWVIVMWVDGNPDDAICLGQDFSMKDMILSEYKDTDTQVLFQDIDEKIKMVYNKGDDILEIGKSDFREASRKDDAVKVTIPSGTFIVSVSGGSGAPAVGVPNSAPIDVDGTIQEGSSQIMIGDK